ATGDVPTNLDWDYPSGDVQISPGKAYGRVVAYLLKGDGNLWAWDQGTEYQVSTGGGVAQIAGSGNGDAYILKYDGSAWMHDGPLYGGTFHFIGVGITQISAGTDSWGNSTVDALRTDGSAQQWEIGNGTLSVKTLANAGGAREVSAGEGGHDFYVDGYSQ